MALTRRRFVSVLGKGMLVFGSGILAGPFGACSRDDYQDALDALGRMDLSGGLDSLEADGTIRDLTPEEEVRFQQELKEAQDSADPDLLASRVPPGQTLVESLWVFGTNPSPRSRADWRFSVSGNVANPLNFTWEEFQALPQIHQVSDFHCVTGVSILDLEWDGVRVADLMNLAEPGAGAGFVIFDCEKGYTTNLTLGAATRSNVLIATGLGGGLLPVTHGGPARGMVPDLYGYKSGKWVTGLRVLDQDEPGFWEKLGYSNTADPWTEDRFS